MSVLTVSQTIAEDTLLCRFFQGTLNELNIDIESGLIKEDEWVFGLVTPPQIEDTFGADNPTITTTYPFRAYIVKRIAQPTNDYRTDQVQPVIDLALAMARKFVHLFNDKEFVIQTKKVTYPSIYGQFDLHLFGVGINCDFVLEEGLTGCEPLPE